MASEKIKTTRAFDGKLVEVWLNDDGTANVTAAHGFGWNARHIALSPSVAILVADEASLFDSAEMGHLVRAAKKLAASGKTVLPGDLRREASRASHKAGTRPADVAPPRRAVLVSVWTPDELRARASGAIVCPRGAVAVKVDA